MSLGLNGFNQVTESYNNIIKGSDFIFNPVHDTFTHVYHDFFHDDKDETIKAYKTLGKMISRAKLLNNVEEDNRALDYDYEFYDISRLVIIIGDLCNNIEIYNLYKRIGEKPRLQFESVPFIEPTLEELQLLTLKAIESFTKNSMKQI